MLTWIVAAAAGVAVAALLYGLGGRSGVSAWLRLALLRAFALTLLFALIFDAAVGAPRMPSPLIALDASGSWMRAADGVAWREATARAAGAGHGEVVLFGDSSRLAPPPVTPADHASRVQGAVERAIAAGRPLIVLTDGELDDPAALEAAPAGSRVEVLSPARGPDLAVVSIDAPRFGVSGDSVDVRIAVRAGDVGIPVATLTLLLDDDVLATRALDSVVARSERTEALRVRLPPREGAHRLVAAVHASADVEPRNDSAGVAMDLTRAAGAVLVSTAPDFDARYLVPVLRGAVAIPTEAYFRVAAGNWRREGSLVPVSEGEVRSALSRAPIAILHGDTAYFGAPRAVAGGALALAPAIPVGDGEWYAVSAPPSPLAAALAGATWDSLPPLLVAGGATGLGWDGLVAARARRLERRPVVTGTDRGRRVVVVGATGFWRWRFRGGVAADAHSALWGGIFDWLAGERPDPRSAVPASGVLRAGEPVRWRRGMARDSVVVARVALRGDAAPDSVTIRFPGNALEAETAPLWPGVYDVEVPGGRTVLHVSASRELLPTPPTVASGSVPGVPVAGERPRLRDLGWAYLLLVGALCAEWLLRRRRGLR